MPPTLFSKLIFFFFSVASRFLPLLRRGEGRVDAYSISFHGLFLVPVPFGSPGANEEFPLYRRVIGSASCVHG